MPDDGRPDLRHAQAWLKDIRASLLDARNVLDTIGENLPGDEGHASASLRTLQSNMERDAETLGDIIARANIVDRYRVELPTVEQANALARLAQGRSAKVASVMSRPFDLPADYLMVVYEDGFTCGIAPNGDVSS